MFSPDPQEKGLIYRTLTYDPQEMARRGRIGAYRLHATHSPKETPKAAREALNQLMDRRRAEDKTYEPGITVIPGVEACHKGPIPLAAIADVLLIDQHDWNLFRGLGQPNNDTIQQIDEFEATLPAHEDDPTVQALLAGRRRAMAKHSEE